MSVTKSLKVAVYAAACAMPIMMTSGPGTARAETPAPTSFKSAAEALLTASFPADGPGAAVIVTRGGRTLYSSGRGLADLETRLPITPDTAFKLGSIVKQFTAATVLQLVAEGKIGLDNPISRFFPDFPQPGGSATIGQLLNHSSGIQDFSKIPGFMGSEPTMRPNSTADLLAVTRSRPSPSEPGHRWEYNNGGYVVLGAIIEHVTGTAWHEAISDRIARPLGLKSLTYAATGESDPARARGYSLQGGQQLPARGVHMSVAHAAGGLVGSARDLAKWADALHGGRVVTADLYREMIQPARLADGSTQPYGFGLRLQELRGRKALVHGGSGRGIDTDSIYLPSEDLFVAVLANSDDPATDPSTLTRRLAAIALGEPFPSFTRADVPIVQVEPLFGSYRLASGGAFEFFGRDGKFYMMRGENQMEALPGGDDRFFFGPDVLTWVRFVRQANGAHLLEVHEVSAAQPERAVRAGPPTPPLAIAAAVLQSYVGTYATEGPVVTVALAENGSLTIAPAGQPPLPMRPVSETEFRVDAAGFRVVFHREEGDVNHLTLHRGARELHGRRSGN
ncbi:MAG TPA: serine hydrolase domain-containing protein [Allosphingosinicella sp.]|jgi:CubicO group peptidase (beta-lactamase class C family)|uniref:serine hydrolase domain-containing protein n=1 Tax=Allosphingosinicella sp. TaxID=2823234 RepID=UPI002F27CCCD